MDAPNPMDERERGWPILRTEDLLHLTGDVHGASLAVPVPDAVARRHGGQSEPVIRQLKGGLGGALCRHIGKVDRDAVPGLHVQVERDRQNRSA